MEKLAIYPGSFDPITNGHIDIIKRAKRIFDRIIIAILINPEKEMTFTVEERKAMLVESLKECKIKGVQVDTFKGLLVNYMKEKRCNVIIRGLRMFSDFEFEFQMALMNKKLYDDFEAVYFIPAERYSYISSRIVKQICILDGDVSDFVPRCVLKRLKKMKKIN